jgi:hypothetical protein
MVMQPESYSRAFRALRLWAMVVAIESSPRPTSGWLCCAPARSSRVSRTYAARSLPRPTKTKRARGLTAGEAQLPLFSHLDKPVARLGDFVEGIAPVTVVTEIEFLRKRTGLTQSALAE